MNALDRYKSCVTGNEIEPNPVERLRFFLSMALTGQDWLDVEQFIDDVNDELAAAKAEIEQMKVKSMLKYAEKQLNQRRNKPTKKHALETMK